MNKDTDLNAPIKLDFGKVLNRRFSCATCPYWQHIGDQQESAESKTLVGIGLCRATPPVAANPVVQIDPRMIGKNMPAMQNAVAMFPMTTNRDWCKVGMDATQLTAANLPQS